MYLLRMSLLVIAVGSPLLSACGQKGPLFLPPPDGIEDIPAQAPEAAKSPNKK